MDIVGTLAATLGGALYRGHPTPPQPSVLQDPNTAISNYRILWKFYQQAGLYDDLVYLLNLEGVNHEALLALRCPAHRVVEFHAAKMFPGANLDDALPIEGTSQDVIEAIHKVWKWSNWADLKQVYARKLAALGDGFIKVVAKRDENGQFVRPRQVYLQLLHAETTTQIDHDNRGFLTYLRLDVPGVRRDAKGQEQTFWTTEVWDKRAGTMRLWEHEKGPDIALDRLGTPKDDETIRQMVGDDFIPVSQARFKNDGELRGQGAYAHALDKIHEVDRQATRLHQMLFRHNKNTFVMRANAMTGDNRPMPPPRLEGEATGTPRNTVQLGDEEFYRLPGVTTLESLVPNINYAAALAILQDQVKELEKDLPELKYYRLEELGTQLSGRAVRLMLGDAVDVAVEGRANAESALIRANQMALSIGNALGAFSVPGTFVEGSFDHSFRDRPVIPTSDLEDAQASLAEANAGQAWKQLGVSKRRWLEDHGYSPDEIEEMARENEADTATQTNAAMDAFNRGLLGNA